MSIGRKVNIERHHKIVNFTVEKFFPPLSAILKGKVNQLKGNMAISYMDNNNFSQITDKNKAITEVSNRQFLCERFLVICEFEAYFS